MRPATWHPHRLALAAIVAVIALGPACGDDDSDPSSAADAANAADTAGTADTADAARGCPVDEAAVEDLFDVDVVRNPAVAPGVETCGFGVEGKPGFGFNLTFLGDDVAPYGSYDAAVEQMGTEPASSEGTGLVPVGAGDEAVARVSAGHAELLARDGDGALLVTALLPPDHPLVAADDDLLMATTDLANLAL